MIKGRKRINAKKNSKQKSTATLTNKQEALVTELINAKPGDKKKDILERAGYDPKNNHSSREIATVKDKLELINDSRLDLLKRYIPEDKVFGVLREALEANRTIHVKDKDGNVLDILTAPDWFTRLKASSQAMTAWELLRKSGSGESSGELVAQINILSKNFGTVETDD